MKNKLSREIFFLAILVLLLLAVLNPFNIFMPSTLEMTLLCFIVAFFGIFAVFIFKERVSDEREELHRSFSGRVAFLSGAAVLILGILVSHFEHRDDFWLKISLVIMMLSKTIALLYSKKYR